MQSRGWIHVICGPMFSGKTEALLRAVRRLEIAGHKVGLFKPRLDTRTEKITSRNGISLPSVSVEWSGFLLGLARDIDIVAIDEAQFFDMDLPTTVKALVKTKRVIISGLDRDFLGRSFGPMGALLVEADSVDKLAAICFVCKEEATLTQRLVNGKPAKRNDPLIVVGGINDDVYEARCRKCWEIG